MTLKLSNFGLMAVVHNSMVSLPSSCSQNLIIQSTLNGIILWQTMEEVLLIGLVMLWSMLFTHVLTNRVVIRSPKQFAEFANEILPKITVQYVENESMEPGYQSECWEKAKKVKWTLKVHCVTRFMQNSSRQLKFFMTSKSHNPLAEVQYQVALLPQHVSYNIRTYVLVQYEGELWPGQITKVEQDRVRVKFFQKATAQGSIWRWPDKPDEGFYQTGDIEREIETPLDIASSSSSLRPSNILVRVAELDYLYR